MGTVVKMTTAGLTLFLRAAMTALCSLSSAMASSKATGLSGKIWRTVSPRAAAECAVCAPSNTSQPSLLWPACKGATCSRAAVRTGGRRTLIKSVGYVHDSYAGLTARAELHLRPESQQCWCSQSFVDCRSQVLSICDA